MISTKSRISEKKLDQALLDIRQHIADPRSWQFALQQLSSIKDYSMGEERFCSAQAALECCERLKSHFPPSAPAGPRKTIDEIAEEIRNLQRQEAPDVWSFTPVAFILLGLAAVAFWFLSR